MGTISRSHNLRYQTGLETPEIIPWTSSAPDCSSQPPSPFFFPVSPGHSCRGRFRQSLGLLCISPSDVSSLQDTNESLDIITLTKSVGIRWHWACSPVLPFHNLAIECLTLLTCKWGPLSHAAVLRTERNTARTVLRKCLPSHSHKCIWKSRIEITPLLTTVKGFKIAQNLFFHLSLYSLLLSVYKTVVLVSYVACYQFCLLAVTKKEWYNCLKILQIFAKLESDSTSVSVWTV